MKPRATSHALAITGAELALLDTLRHEPELVENLRNASFEQAHEREMFHRLRRVMIRAVGAQRAVDAGRRV